MTDLDEMVSVHSPRHPSCLRSIRSSRHYKTNGFIEEADRFKAIDRADRDALECLYRSSNDSPTELCPARL